MFACCVSRHATRFHAAALRDLVTATSPRRTISSLRPTMTLFHLINEFKLDETSRSKFTEAFLHLISEMQDDLVNEKAKMVDELKAEKDDLVNEKAKMVDELKAEKAKMEHMLEKEKAEMKAEKADEKAKMEHMLEKEKAEMKAEKAEIKAEIKAEKAEIKAEIKAEKVEIKAEIKAEQAEIKAEIKAEQAEIKAETKAEMQQIRKDKDSVIEVLTKQLADIKEDHFRQLAKHGTVLNNRAVVEIGAARYLPRSTLTDAINTFVETHFLHNNKLTKYCEQVCLELEKFDLVVKDKSGVVRELKDYVHEVSKPLHNKVLDRSRRGYIVGGDPPFAQAVACLVLKFQEEKCVVDLPVLLMDGSGDIKCALVDGHILSLPEFDKFY